MYTTLKLLYWHELGHAIFRDTVFYYFTNMTYKVFDLQIMSEYTPRSVYEREWNKQVGYNYLWDANELTTELSRNKNNAGFCLNHLTTSKTIRDNTLGAAYTKGVCARLKKNYFTGEYTCNNAGFSSLSVRHTYLPEPVSLGQIHLPSRTCKSWSNTPTFQNM